jgi:hypothetical protein
MAVVCVASMSPALMIEPVAAASTRIAGAPVIEPGAVILTERAPVSVHAPIAV